MECILANIHCAKAQTIIRERRREYLEDLSRRSKHQFCQGYQSILQAVESELLMDYCQIHHYKEDRLYESVRRFIQSIYDCAESAIIDSSYGLDSAYADGVRAAYAVIFEIIRRAYNI